MCDILFCNSFSHLWTTHLIIQPLPWCVAFVHVYVTATVQSPQRFHIFLIVEQELAVTAEKNVACVAGDFVSFRAHERAAKPRGEWGRERKTSIFPNWQVDFYGTPTLSCLSLCFTCRRHIIICSAFAFVLRYVTLCAVHRQIFCMLT